uniref:small heat shock protein, chloroplastic n=1 Tax=Erigeron canadensis TaxID=72917 RepID=UPI001CB96012|nr:small heat shock protein, chloroplastic [Erigeron canadensis]
MASQIVFKRGTTAVASSLFNKLFNPIRSVSVVPSVQRSFNTDSAQVSAYEDFNRSVEEDRRADNSVSRRRDNDFFSDVFDPFAPTRNLSQVLNMMDQMMDSPFMAAASRGGAFGARRGWDAKEDDNTLSLRFEMPGLDKDNVKISVEQNTLVIKGEAEKEAEDEELTRRYSTRLDLPDNVYKFDEINAEMKNGVLKVVVPKVKPEERKDVFQVQVN